VDDAVVAAAIGTGSTEAIGLKREIIGTGKTEFTIKKIMM